MSSDGYFEDDIDTSLLNELDALEAADFSSSKNSLEPFSKAPPLAKQDTSEYFDDTFEVDDSELLRLDNFIEDAYQGKAAPVAGPSNVARMNSKGMLQTTLYGEVLTQPAPSNKSKGTSSRSGQMQRSTSKRNAFGQQAPKTKMWDRTAFAKSGWKKSANDSKGKGKGRAQEHEEGEGDEEMEFEQFPAPFVSVGPPPPMQLAPDLLEAKHWLYPLNQPKRDYQFNIVKHCLFENTLVALPTGLGKTFVAGVVMLNYYRWFPEGKVIFVAPTKPLVAQQIDACHRTCGIPGHDAAEMTGEIPRATRSRLWQSKRVFYMTPQTLINDLATENCNPLDIILIVVDEAHKATGDYAYSQVVRFMMAKNPHFRILALSATPGGDPEKVQMIIDHLHISRIEIRDEASMDLREYMFTKEIKQHVIPMNDDINKVVELLTKLMRDIAKKLENAGVIEPLNVVKVGPFRLQMKSRELSLNKQHPWAFVPLAKLGKLARAMGYLFEASLKMCHTCLKEVLEGIDDEPGKKKCNPAVQKQLVSDPTFKALMREIEGQKNRMQGFGPHPKMEKLKILLVQHFGTHIDDARDGEVGDDTEMQSTTRAMVFVTNRGCVDEIVELLNEDRPLIKATKFVGQGTDKQGGKGLAQKEQLDVIQKFKAGQFNVLVATSIGEEGLDIGEVDLIVCYDAQKAPIRMLQRIGRTGRKRTGYVHVLLSEIREEANWEKAKDTYGEVQKSIVRGDMLELYADVERLLPDHMKPEVLEKKMDIEEYVREEKGKKAAASSSVAAAKKRKRDADDMGRNIPPGASSGFVKASDLKKRKKAKVKEFDPLAGEDDDTDREIEAGLDAPPRRTVSTSAAPSSPKKTKKVLRKAATMDSSKAPSKEKKKKKKKKSTKSRKEEVPSMSQFSQMGVDDSDDLEIENGPRFARHSGSPSRSSASPMRERPKSPKYWTSSPKGLSTEDSVEIVAENIFPATMRKHSRPKPSSSNKRPKSPKYWTSSPEMHAIDEVIDIPTSPHSSPSNSRTRRSQSPQTIRHKNAFIVAKEVQSPTPSKSASREPDGQNDSMAWLLEGDDEPEDFQIVDSSPIIGQKRKSSPSHYNDSVEIVANNLPSPSLRGVGGSRLPQLQPDDSVEFISYGSAKTGPIIPQRSSTSLPPHSASLNTKRPSFNSKMPPPDLPLRFSERSPALHSDQEYPEPSFAVRPAGKRPKKRVVVTSEPGSPLMDIPNPSQRRLQRKRSQSPPALNIPPTRQKRNKDPDAPRKLNPWIDAEAAHSGDEVSEGGSSQVDDVENEFDREFLQGLPETQVSPTYDQSLAYRQSLFTQAPASGRAPMFTNRPAARSARFAVGLSSRPRLLISSSPPVVESEPNEYAMGSFVVDDDEEIVYASSDA